MIIPADVDVRKRRLELMIWAFVLSLAYYPEYFGFLAWFALVRPIMIITRLRGRPAFNAAYFFAFFFNVFSLYWVAMVTPPGTISAIVIVSFYYAIVLTVFNRLYHFKPLLGLIALPFLWTGMEFFRTLTEFAFPWSDLGYTQAYYLYMLQIVSVISVHGLSFIIVIVNLLLVQALRKELFPERRVTYLLVSVAVVALVGAYGWITLPRFPVPGTVDVAVLQGSIPIEVKWAEDNAGYTFQRYDSLAQTIVDSAVDLYIWPETAVPCYLSHDHVCRAEIGEIARRTATPHLVGGLGGGIVNEEPRHYNSCFHVNSAGIITGRYDKVKLVPFSEQVPYRNVLGFLRKDVLSKYLTFIETYNVQWWSDFQPGDSIRLFSIPEATYGVLICFESTFPEYSRAMVRQGADFIVGITNDTWFGTSVGIHMHSRIFLTRAVENRCWMARAANSGLSYIVDPYGRIHGELDTWEVAVLRGKVGLIDGRSVFTKYGDVVGRVSFLLLAAAVVILAAAWILRKIIPRFSS